MPLEISSLFLYTEQKLEHAQNSALTSSSITTTSVGDIYIKPQMKHKQFKVTIYGISSSDEDCDSDFGVIVKVTQDTTVLQVIEEVLTKVDKRLAESKDYLLIEEMEHGWISIDSQGTSYSHHSTTTLYSNKFLQLTRNKTLSALLSNKTAEHDGGKLRRSALINNKNTNKDIRILQNQEKIMEAQNKWTGNGKFIIKNKSTFLVSLIF